jgi:hypothetical protein
MDMQDLRGQRSNREAADSPSDVLQDYTYGYEDDKRAEIAEPPKNARSTAPLAIARKGRSGGRMDYAGEESPGLGSGPNRVLDAGRYDDGEDDLR